MGFTRQDVVIRDQRFLEYALNNDQEILRAEYLYYCASQTLGVEAVGVI